MKIEALALIMVLTQSAPAMAHAVGHGPKVEGTGPRGGKLVSIVLAKEADDGEKAKAQAIAEWTRQGDTLEVSLLGVDRKTPLALKGPAEVKWIFIGGTLAKPEILKFPVASGQERILQAFDPTLLAKAGQVEVILPALGATAEKHVLILSLGAD